MSTPTLQLVPQSEPTSSFLSPTVAPSTPQLGAPASDYASNNQAAFGNAAVARVASQANTPKQQAFASNTEAVRSLKPNETEYENAGPSDQAGLETPTGVEEGAETTNQEPEASATEVQPSPRDDSTTGPGGLSQDATLPTSGAMGPNAASPLGGSSPSQQAASTEDLFQSFTFATASDIALQLGVIGDGLANQFSLDRSTYVEATPSLSVSIPKDEAAEALASKAGPVEARELPSADLVALPQPGKAQPLSAEESGVPAQPEGDGVGTSAGASPQFRADGEADATRMAPAADSARTTAQQAAQIIGSEIAANTTADRMIPAAVDKQERIELPASAAVPQATQSMEMLEYLQTDVGSDVRAIADSDFAPLLESSLAAPRSQVADAAKTRDDERQKAFDEAQVEADTASAAATEEQQKAIADGRSLVETEKQKGLAEQQGELAKFDGEVSSRHQTQQEEIARTVESEQTKANEAIAKGEADAGQAAVKADEDRKTEEDNANADRPKKKKNKWGQLTDWFKNAIKDWTNKLVNAVKKVFDAAKSFVAKVLTEAKKLAVGIITVLRNTVVGMIKVFAEGLKILVSGLLFAFPKLRAKVNSAIDGVVEKAIQVVDTVAKKLEETVVALIDRVQSSVNKTLDFFESVIVTQIQIAGALLSGNFLEAAKILFLAACKAVGIPGEEFLDILADANDALMDIIKRPAKFLGYLLKSVGQGMKSFFSNFPQRMVAGLTGWLFGQVAEGGITLPKSFDLKNIFTLLIQVMGITYDYIRGMVISLVGEKAVSVVEQVMTPIRILFTEGPGALWHWLADQADQAKKVIVEEASKWLITQIITQAAIKLATMFTPVGAFVQAVLMMYNTIMFFVEKIKEIFAWVKSITASLKTIAIGAISAAADYIDQAMSKSIPLIITFLAKLMGIDGVAGQIRQVVTKLRTPVDKAISFVVENLIKLAKAAWGGINKGATAVKDAVVGWWEAKELFTDVAGASHTLFIQREGDRHHVMVASAVQKYEKLLAKIEAQYRDSPDASKRETYERAKVAYDLLTRRIERLEAKGGSEEDQADLPELKELALKSHALMVETDGEQTSVLEWVHLALDGAGMVPALGIVPDAVNTGLYLIEGDWVNAGLSATAMIEILGQGVTVTKHGVRVSKETLERTGKEGLERELKNAKKLAGKKSGTQAGVSSSGRTRGATAEGLGKDFRYEYHPEVQAPHVDPKLKTIHPDSTYASDFKAKESLEHWRGKPTTEIVESLKPGSKEPLTTYSDGRMADGNTRIRVLEERGYPVDRLPRTPRNSSAIAPLETESFGAPKSFDVSPLAGQKQPSPENSRVNNAADFARLKHELRATMSRPNVNDPELSRYMDELYRPNATIGSGSTAAAVRYELATGRPVGGRKHSQKARDMITPLDRWLKNNPNSSPGDRAAAENVIQDLVNALNGN